jgi:sucrose-6-phosphate hydrolase SacC (GH32 family)
MEYCILLFASLTSITSTQNVGEDPLIADSPVVHQNEKREGILSIVDNVYQETYRPQFHFSARENWLNDPNGLVFYDGEYHMFFQHNPTGIDWGNMTWGHAISPDMLHWTQLPNAIEPDELGTIFSGSAVVDWKNTSGFQTGNEKVLVAFYTSAGDFAPEPKPFTQSIAHSNDRGRTWTKYEGNPVIGHIEGQNRDPKVIWHEPTGKWVMALYLDGNKYALLGSKNLKEWESLCEIEMPGVSECPDLFELPVDGSTDYWKWVFWGGNGNYVIGSFDGTTFTKETEPFRSEWGRNAYAGQTWSDVPAEDGRKLQILWMRGDPFPGMPFNQQMSFPCEVTLRTFPEGIRLCRQPVREIEEIRGRHQGWEGIPLVPGENPLGAVSGELFDIAVTIGVGSAKRVGLAVRGVEISFNSNSGELRCLDHSAPLGIVDDKIDLRVLVDRTAVEIFAGGGKVVMSFALPLVPDNQSLSVFAEGGEAVLDRLDLWQLRSVWAPL